MANTAFDHLDLEALVVALVPAVLAAGDVIMAVHARGVVGRSKADGSPVSEADEAAEAILLAALAQAVPNIAVISEENEASHHLAAPDLFFLVDPLDGTKEFLKPEGQGSFTVNIGLIHQGEPVMGIIYAPAHEALYTGIVGVGAMKHDSRHKKAIAVRDVPDEALAVASLSHRDEVTNQWLAEHHLSHITAIGSSLKFCLLAEGLADVYPRFGPTMEWDIAAGDAILRAAGGMVRRPDDHPYCYGKQGYHSGAFIATGKWDASKGDAS